jgi:hypothetical protein
MLGVEHLLDEELTVQPLPHEASLHVGEGDDDGVHLAGGNQLPQLVGAQHPRDPTPPPPSARHVTLGAIGDMP